MPSTRPWLKRNWQKVKGEADLQTVYISNVLLIQLLHGHQKMEVTLAQVLEHNF